MSGSDNSQLPRDSMGNIPAFGVPNDIPADKPWKNDCANREEFAEKFVTVIDNIGAKSSAAILLEGEWGTGKSFFLKSFRKHLDKKGYKAIYFDAFAEDFSTDPLLAICGQLWKELSVGDSIKGGVNKNLTKVLKDIMIVGGVAAEALLHANNININIKENAKNLKTMGIGSLLEYAEYREKVEQLKTDLSSTVAESQSQNGKNTEVKPLVFIIDELDRCRPTFALELLERVKHLFQVQGIIFVFGANKNSLMKSVRSEYGDQEDEYLQKFFDLELKLPNAPSSVLAKQYVEKLDYKILRKEYWEITDRLLNKNGRLIENLLENFFDDFYYPAVSMMEMTLRETERSLQMFILFLLVSSREDKVNFVKAGAGLCLILLKIKHLDLYEKFVREDETCEQTMKGIPNFYYGNLDRADGATIKTPQEMTEKLDRYFRMFLFSLAKDKEKDRIVAHPRSASAGSLLGLDVYGVYMVQINQFDRAEVVRMLENLGCS